MESSNLIEEHLFLAELIAFDYANIPGCQWDEARSEACLALVRASEKYDPEQGEFTPFASRAIRNALNTLYSKQLRLLKIFPKSLDDPVQQPTGIQPHLASSDDTNHPADGRQDVRKEVRNREASAVLESLMNLLAPRERLIVQALKAGKSYSEIGETLQISKQAAHKSARVALGKLRSGLERLGYQGIASDGLLDSRQNMRIRHTG